MAEVRIDGLKELKQALEGLPAKMEQNIVRGGLRAGAKVIVDEARRLCPVGGSTGPLRDGEDPGALRDSIRSSAQRTQNGVAKTIIKAGGGKKQVFYAHLVEYGTASHYIKPKNRKSLFLASVFKEGVDHPGAQAKPFMRPAFDGKGAEAVNAAADYMRIRLAKEVEKLKP